MRRLLRLALGALLLALAAPIRAQPPDRIATTAQALVANPLFFNGKRIVIRQPVKMTGQLSELDGTAKPVFIFWRDKTGGSDGEIRGDFYDLGRVLEGDQRFSSYDFAPVLQAASNGHWPARDQVFVILGASFIDNPAPTTPTVRAISLLPEQFDNRSVTLIGRFRGRNLFGDLPQSVAKSKWDFVLQSADAAIWITGLRPKGKDFDLDPSAHVDTGKWLEVKGTVERDTSGVWIAAESIRLTTAPAAEPVEVAGPRVPAEPPPSVIFSAPLSDDTDVPAAGRIRIQFSRDMNPQSFNNRVRIHYGGTTPPPNALPAFTVNYNDGTRSIEIRFKEPLSAFQVVVVELTSGITAIDGQGLQPWSLKFTTAQ